MNSFVEPVSGWLDNLNGVGAAMVIFGLGVTPVYSVSKEAVLELLPIDFNTRLTLVAAYKKGLETLR